MIPAPHPAQASYKIIPTTRSANAPRAPSARDHEEPRVLPALRRHRRKTIDNSIDPCFACAQSGMITCGACEGSGVALTTKVRVSDDRRPPPRVRPDAPEKFKSRIESMLVRNAWFRASCSSHNPGSSRARTALRRPF
jgi:hypothetical protein